MTLTHSFEFKLICVSLLNPAKEHRYKHRLHSSPFSSLLPVLAHTTDRSICTSCFVFMLCIPIIEVVLDKATLQIKVKFNQNSFFLRTAFFNLVSFSLFLFLSPSKSLYSQLEQCFFLLSHFECVLRTILSIYPANKCCQFFYDKQENEN